MPVEDLHKRRPHSGRLRIRLHQAGHALLSPPPLSKPAARATRWLPLLLVASLATWLLLPASWLVTLTPPVGTAALICAGLYLGHVMLQVGRYHYHHLGGSSDDASAACRLRAALLRAAWLLAATVVLAAVYLGLATWQLQGPEDAGVARLLWALTVGGMMLSLVVGEVCLRFVESVEHYLHRS